MSDDTLGYSGTAEPGDNLGDFNTQSFLAQSLINRISSCTLVKILSVTNTGDLAPVGLVDVQPLVNQLDGNRNAVPHAVIYNLPYFRLQGGGDAVIIDPKVGDIGIAVFADHDISGVKASKGQANPGSMRRFDMADGLYFGGVLNGTPTQYIRYSADGIECFSPTKILMRSPEIELRATNRIQHHAPTITTDADTITSTATASISDAAPLITETAPVIALAGTLVQTAGAGVGTSTMQGPLTVQLTVKSNTEVVAVTTPLHTHVHGGVASGGSNTAGPTP